MKNSFLIVIGILIGSTIYASQDQIILKNKEDMKWEKMLPELGDSSPLFSILREDKKTKATTLMIRFPKAIYIHKHTHNKSETHILLGGTHIFEHKGKRYDVKERGYIYMPGQFIHEAWVPAGAEAVIILEDGWKVNWLKGGPSVNDLGKAPPPL